MIKRICFRTIELVHDILFSAVLPISLRRYSSIKQNHISLGIDGDKWIFARQKTDTSKIPLLPMAMEIDKYKKSSNLCK
jgi:hypothetical protein